MSFDPYNRPLKIWESIEILTPKVRIHLGVYTPWSMKCDSRTHFSPAPWQAFALVASPSLGLR